MAHEIKPESAFPRTSQESAACPVFNPSLARHAMACNSKYPLWGHATEGCRRGLESALAQAWEKVDSPEHGPSKLGVDSLVVEFSNAVA